MQYSSSKDADFGIVISQNYLKRELGLLPRHTQVATELDDNLLSQLDDHYSDTVDILDPAEFEKISELEDQQFMLELANTLQNDETEQAWLDNEQRRMGEKFRSPLFEQLRKQETSLDDLEIGDSKDGTYKATYTAVRKLNMFWEQHQVDRTTEPTLYKLRSSFSSFLDGFAAFCAMSHAQRNILLAHWVVKMVSIDQSNPQLAKRVLLML
jgi:hypothetical protein